MKAVPTNAPAGDAPPRVGQRVTVRGHACEIFCVRPLGTIDVVSLCGRFAWRVSGLGFVVPAGRENEL